MPVKVKFLDPPDPKQPILPEMAARVSFLAQAIDPKTLDQPPKLVVPTAAVTQRNGKDVVLDPPSDLADGQRAKEKK